MTSTTRNQGSAEITTLLLIGLVHISPRYAPAQGVGRMAVCISYIARDTRFSQRQGRKLKTTCFSSGYPKPPSRALSPLSRRCSPCASRGWGAPLIPLAPFHSSVRPTTIPPTCARRPTPLSRLPISTTLPSPPSLPSSLVPILVIVSFPVPGFRPLVSSTVAICPDQTAVRRMLNAFLHPRFSIACRELPILPESPACRPDSFQCRSTHLYGSTRRQRPPERNRCFATQTACFPSSQGPPCAFRQPCSNPLTPPLWGDGVEMELSWS